MSTTTDLGIAITYSTGKDDDAATTPTSKQSLIFKIITDNKLQRGADLQWLSAFPAEAEVLYPPLTYLQPTGRTQKLELGSCGFTFVEVRPTIA